LEVDKSEVQPKGDITLSRVEGVIVVATPLSEPSTNSKLQSSVKGESAEDDNVMTESGDVWETVEVRVRGSRKKPGERTNQSGSRKAYHASHSTMSLADSKRGKSTRTPTSRKKVVSRKMARDILASVIDRVDDTIREKKQNPPQPQSAAVNPWNKRSQFIKPVQAPASDNLKGRKEKRDFIFRKQAGASSKPVITPSYSGNEDKTRLSVPAKSLPSKNSLSNLSKGKVLSSADQNTAPTYQETISATSAASNEATGLKRGVPSPVSKADTEDSDEGPQKSLPTHLSPKSVNSANSSVASSLEVPHTRRHHSNSTGDVNDVGYHLLDVCDRLTGDMSLFMSRRNSALNTRRRERGALLSVLQDTVAGIWPGKCHVEMYGSCATQLDLPSSDLDVVVRGMSHSLDVMMSAPPTPQGTVRSMSVSSESVNMSQAMEDQGFGDEVLLHAHNIPPVFMSMHMNGERVKRLAATLEQQPWCVQVNAIPTASVPVVKVLADPSKLPGVSSTIQYQKLAAQAAVASGHSQVPAPSEDSSAGGNPTSRPQPWRGADVMNGLLSLDITFEGPEHGGIGSTEFSAHAVAEMCQATGLMPDATPFVQVLMVLKELLAQRKLNEPFSGGLSSYAVLLLVVALVRERAVIREEIERVERQRKAVAAGDVSVFVGTPSPFVNDFKKSSQNGSSSQLKKDNNGKLMKGAGNKAKKGNTVSKTAEQPVRRVTSGIPKVSSWATVAKKPSNLEDSKEPVKDSTPKTSRKTSHKPSFADAVAGSNPVAAKSNATVHKKRVVPAPPARTIVRDVTDAGRKNKNIDSALKEPSGSGPAQSKKDVAKEQTNMGTEQSLGASLSFCPQGYNDVIEVLCSGEVTAGKLLMHFLLYYGQHFDAQNTAIDVSGKHDRSFMGQYSPYSHFSSYIPRHAPGTIDPVTGMFSVDPIVIYDPLEGAESNNVARRCFAWNSIRWIFAQSYATLSSAVERSTTPPTSPGGVGKTSSTAVNTGSGGREVDSSAPANDPDGVCDQIDPSSPLLRCLLSI
jgi:DNA polymerase sigma